MQLPIFQTVREILDYCWTNHRVGLKHAVLPMGIVVIGNLIGWQLGYDLASFQSPAFAALNILSAIVFLPFTVTWYRMVILGQDSMTTRGLFTFSRLEGQLLRWQFIIALIVIAAGGAGMLVIGAVVGAVSAASPAAGQALSAVLLGIWAVLLISVACRLSLVLAMAATDRPAVLSEAWARTKGLGGHMAAIFILCIFCAVLLLIPMQMVVVVFTSLIGLISEGLSESAGVVLSTIVGAFGSLMVLVFPTTLFGFVYNRISQTMASGQDLGTEAAGASSDTEHNTSALEDAATVDDVTKEIDTTIERLVTFVGDKPKDTAADIRVLMDGFFAQFPMPNDTAVDDVDAGGVSAQWVTAAGSDQNKVILYLHGGGFSAGSFASHQRIASDLGVACGTRVLLIDYRLAPEHPFPAGLDDCVTAYRWLLGEGFKPGHIAIAGDSAGGGLAISTALCLKEDGIDQPAALIALSPWVNMACDGETMESKAKDDPITTQESLLRAAGDYLNGHDNKDPYVSPIYGDLRGLPPTLIQVGSREVLLDDSRKLAVRARADDVPVRLEEWPGLFHVWHMMADWLTDGRRALGGIGTFVRRHLG